MHRTTLRPRYLVRALWLAALASVALMSELLVSAGPLGAQEPLTPTLTIPQGEYRQVQMSKKQNIREARSENPKVVRLFADAERPDVVTIKGEEPGTSKIFLSDADKNTEVLQIVVPPPEAVVRERKRQDILEIVKKVAPTANIDVVIGPGDTAILSGVVGDIGNRQAIMALAEGVVGPNKVTDNMRIGGVQQVQLEVLVAVVNRTEARNMAFSWFYNTAGRFTFNSILQAPLTLNNALAVTGQNAVSNLAGSPNLIFGITDGRHSFAGYLQALRTQGLAKVLAEPRVMTLSGRPAQIVSGGETPLLTSSGTGAPNVTYKQFGTVVDFLPIVQGDGKIHLEVAPQLSSLNQALGVTIAGINPTIIPGFNTRSARVAVIMEDGQTLAIGGLIQSTLNASTTKVPILGDLPIFGAAFRTISSTETEEELIILVTPRLVDPLCCTQIPKYLPGRETRNADDYELFLEGIMEAPRGQREVCVGRDNGGYLGSHMTGPSAGAYPCGGDGNYGRFGHGCATGTYGAGTCDSCPGDTVGNGHSNGPAAKPAPQHLGTPGQKLPSGPEKIEKIDTGSQPQRLSTGIQVETTVDPTLPGGDLTHVTPVLPAHVESGSISLPPVQPFQNEPAPVSALPANLLEGMR